jgi:hypothetical protein
VDCLPLRLGARSTSSSPVEKGLDEESAGEERQELKNWRVGLIESTELPGQSKLSLPKKRMWSARRENKLISYLETFSLHKKLARRQKGGDIIP